MYKHVLIATDGSELAGKAVKTGLMLAKTLKARATAVIASEPWTALAAGEPSALMFPIDDYEKATAENAERVLRGVREDAAKLGVECTTSHIKDFPAEAILAAAKDNDCDLIVMASHGRRGLRRVLLGSQASQVVTQSSVPVLICR
jgi:nucleotide-binding universal stress UspA family protein